MAVLYYIGYSPWSQKARWALDHHGVDYKKKYFTTLFSVPELRLKTKRWTGKVTVPVLIDDSGVYDDSLAIARRADAIGGQAPLFPADRQAEVVRWNAVSDALAEAGRALSTRAVMADPKMLQASMPKHLANLPGSAAVGRFAVKHISRKYALSEVGAEDAMDALLHEVDAALKGDYLLGQFSYADIAIAVALQMVRPVDHPTGNVPEIAKPAWTRPRLAEKYARVLSWRDQLFAQHR